ncbi:hypothetical protein ACGFMO_34680 [Streptomyces niveus]|uniref:hypothetical protein n=1 Tax=Streptomyces niveus TaxID=193462 RepID=UPI003722C0E2
MDLEETDLEGRDYIRQEINRAPQDWVWAWTAEKTFHAACGPGNLTGASRCSAPGRPLSRPRSARPVRRIFVGPGRRSDISRCRGGRHLAALSDSSKYGRAIHNADPPPCDRTLQRDISRSAAGVSPALRADDATSRTRPRSGRDGSPPAAVRGRRRATPVRPGGPRPGRG